MNINITLLFSYLEGQKCDDIFTVSHYHGKESLLDHLNFASDLVLRNVDKYWQGY